jgi:hypothetical protein
MAAACGSRASGSFSCGAGAGPLEAARAGATGAAVPRTAASRLGWAGPWSTVTARTSVSALIVTGQGDEQALRLVASTAEVRLQIGAYGPRMSCITPRGEARAAPSVALVALRPYWCFAS